MRQLKKYQSFKEAVWAHYKANARKFLWRETTDSYKIFVSEVMLQQTQVDRVIPKYDAFIARFPSWRALDRAPLALVLREWQGLGYNRRALALKRAASIVVSRHRGETPRSREELDSLPSIGAATAGAIRAYAWNKPEIFIETNIRTVFLHHFFEKRRKVPDAEIARLVAKTLDRRNPRHWYYALMDYGAMLKKAGCNNRESADYVRQSTFRGSCREARGRVLKFLLERGRGTRKEIREDSGFEESRLDRAVADLAREGFVVARGPFLFICS